MPPRDHAFLSSSSAHRWLVCTASPHYEEQFPDGTSSYAEEGTLAHRICELYAKRKFSGLSTRKFNSELKKAKLEPQYSDEMLHTAEAYVEYLAEKSMEYAEAPYVALEVQVDFSAFVPEGFGTCDCVMIGGDTLHITDYKHGKGVAVSALENPQMRLYALGALARYSAVYGDQIKRVSMGICQPRLTDAASEEALSVADLLAWGVSIRPIAREAFDGPGEFHPGEHCRFCRGKAQCRARAAHFAGFSEFIGADVEGRMTAEDYEVREEAFGYGADLPPILSDADVGRLLKEADGLVAWYKDLQEYATGAILSGKVIPGFKLVEGRSNRIFSDQDAAFNTLVAQGIEEAMLYDRKPKTLSEVEKMLGKKRFAALLNEFVVKPRGKATLVAASDKRPDFNPGAAEFEGVGNG